MRKRNLALAACVLIVSLSAWSPWLTQDFVQKRVVNVFQHSWSSVIDGCGTQCIGCGVIAIRKALFGRFITLEYACGLIPEDSPDYHERATGFISTFGTVHGLPKP